MGRTIEFALSQLIITAVSTAVALTIAKIVGNKIIELFTPIINLMPSL